MRIPAFFALAVLLMPVATQAKRMEPAKVEPVVYEGVQYSVPNDDGKRAYVTATDVKSGKKLYEIEIFKPKIDPGLEEDVQWVFIKELRMDNGQLIVTVEGGLSFAVDLKTRQARALKRG